MTEYLIVALYIGYYIYSRCEIYKIATNILDSQRLMFESVLLGLLIIVIINVLTIITKPLFFYLYSYFKIDISNSFYIIDDYTLKILLYILFTILITRLLNGIPRANKNLLHYYKKGLDEFGSNIEKLLFDSIKNGSFIQFTLSNDKVYVGHMSKIQLPKKKREHLDHVIFPAMSGYRDPKTKEIVFTTDYRERFLGPIDKKGSSNSEYDRIPEIIIRHDEIVTVRLYDFPDETIKESKEYPIEYII